MYLSDTQITSSDLWRNTILGARFVWTRLGTEASSAHSVKWYVHPFHAWLCHYPSRNEAGTSAIMSNKGFPMPKRTPSLNKEGRSHEREYTYRKSTRVSSDQTIERTWSRSVNRRKIQINDRMRRASLPLSVHFERSLLRSSPSIMSVEVNIRSFVRCRIQQSWEMS